MSSHTNRPTQVRDRTVTLAGSTIVIAYADNVPDAEFISEAFNVTYITGKRPQELANDAELATTICLGQAQKIVDLSNHINTLENRIKGLGIEY